LRSRKAVDRTGRGGFTMVELVVTLVLVGIALAPMVHGYVSATRTTMETRRLTTAHNLARACLAHLRTVIDYHALSDRSRCSTTRGRFDPPFQAFGYEIGVRRIHGSTSGFEVKMLRLRVIFPGRFDGGNRTLACPESTPGTDSDCDRWDLVSIVSPRT